MESLIGLSVDQVVQEMPAAEPHCRELVDKLVQALESDAGWVELYGITGELIVPDLLLRAGDSEIGSVLGRVKEVCVASCTL